MKKSTKQLMFIAGTDTGVGKTVLTGLLLCHLREQEVRALAIKPVSAGSREDGWVLHRFQQDKVSLEDTNPWHFKTPIAPVLAARLEEKRVGFAEVINRIRNMQSQCETLLIEGAGGLLSPLGETGPETCGKSDKTTERAGIFSALELIQELNCNVLLAAPNKLGIINHVLLNEKIMEASGIKEFTIVLMAGSRAERSSRSNKALLEEMLPDRRIFCLPFLGKIAGKSNVLATAAKKLKKTLAEILG